MKRFAALLCTLAFVSTASAGESGVVVHGFQDMSCGAWAASTGVRPIRDQYIYWFRGFVSGVNFADQQHQIGLAQMPSNETLSLYVDKYCRENPLSGFPGAAFELVRDLRGRSKSG